MIGAGREGFSFAKRLAHFSVWIMVVLPFTPVLAEEESGERTVTYEDFEGLEDSEQAAIILEALASRASQFRATGIGDGTGRRVSLVGFSLPPSSQQTLCRMDLIMVWAEPLIGGPSERDQDDPPTRVERIDVQHSFAEHGLPASATEDERRQACLDGSETLNFFRARDFEQARSAVTILNTIKYTAENYDLPDTYSCENQRSDEPENCEGFAGHLASFTPTVVEYLSDDRLRIHGKDPDAILDLEVGGTIIHSLNLIFAERIYLTNGSSE